MTLPESIGCGVTWLLLGGYAGVLVGVTFRLRKLASGVELALRDVHTPDEIRVCVRALVTENDQLRAELQSKEHHLAAMQARIVGLEGRTKP